jgi:hypothetical protein
MGELMQQIRLAIDPGSSMTKIFYLNADGKSSYITMDPQVSQISGAMSKQYQSSLIDTSPSLTQTWVSDMDNSYAVGALAAHRFRADLRLDERKYEAGIFKILAVLGYLTETLKIEEDSKVTLGLLLPFSEYADRKLLESSLGKIIERFEYCGRRKSMKLEEFVCRPEGFGVYARGLGDLLPREHDIGCLILGHRNASWLQMNRGHVNLEVSQTNDLGFSWLVKEVQQATGISHNLRLAQAVYNAGAKLNEKALEPCISARDPMLAAAELERLRQAILTVKEQYWQQLEDWIRKRVNQVDFVVASGGAAPYVQPQLKKLLKAKLLWGEGLVTDLAKNFNLDKDPLLFRLLDGYGLFQSVISRGVTTRG